TNPTTTILGERGFVVQKSESCVNHKLLLQTLIALILALGLWTLGLMFLESAGVPTVSTSTGYVTYTKGGFLLAARWFYLFGLLWIAQFVIACQYMVVAGAVARWYFSR